MESKAITTTSEPQRLRRHVQRACGEILGLRAVLPETEPCGRIDQELRLAAWRLEQYWSWSEAGTHQDAATNLQASEYRRRLEAAATEATKRANESADNSSARGTLLAISKRICGLYNAAVPTFPTEWNSNRISVQMRYDEGAD